MLTNWFFPFTPTYKSELRNKLSLTSSRKDGFNSADFTYVVKNVSQSLSGSLFSSLFQQHMNVLKDMVKKMLGNFGALKCNVFKYILPKRYAWSCLIRVWHI